jgi:hypothetical protein
MTEELRAKMEELRAIAPRLNKTSDSAATIIKAVEGFLNDLGIGISGSSWFDEQAAEWDEDDTPRKIISRLAYDRMRGEFCIHISNETCREEVNTYGMREDVAESEERCSWSSSTREVKLKSFARLPHLLDDILRNAKSQADEADKAAATVGEMLKTLGIEDRAPVETKKTKAKATKEFEPVPQPHQRRTPVNPDIAENGE